MRYLNSSLTFSSNKNKIPIHVFFFFLVWQKTRREYTHTNLCIFCIHTTQQHTHIHPLVVTVVIRKINAMLVARSMSLCVCVFFYFVHTQTKATLCVYSLFLALAFALALSVSLPRDDQVAFLHFCDHGREKIIEVNAITHGFRINIFNATPKSIKRSSVGY